MTFSCATDLGNARPRRGLAELFTHASGGGVRDEDGAVTVPEPLRDSLNLLTVVLEQKAELFPPEIMTNAADTHTIFGVFHLLFYPNTLA